MNRRDSWKLKNISSRQISLGDLPKVPTLSPNRAFELLNYYPKEELLGSTCLLSVINSGWCTLTRYENGGHITINSDNATEALTWAFKNELTGGGGGDFLPLDGSSPMRGDLNLGIFGLVLGDGSATIAYDPDFGSITFNRPLYTANNGIFTGQITVCGGAGTSDIANVMDMTLANDGTGEIQMNLGTLQIGNGSYVSQGTFDSGMGAANGLSLFCTIGYEMNWQAGTLSLAGPNNGCGTIANLYEIQGQPGEGFNQIRMQGGFDAIMYDGHHFITSPGGVGNPNEYYIALYWNGNTNAQLKALQYGVGEMPLNINLNGGLIDKILVVNGDDSTGTNNKFQIGFGYNGNPGYLHYVTTHHNDGTASGNSINFYTSDGNGPSLFPDDGILGLSIEAGSITVPDNIIMGGGLQRSLKTVTSTYTATATDSVILADATGGAFTVALPTAAGITGREYTVKRINDGSNEVTIQTTNSETVDGDMTAVLSMQYASVNIISDGTNWYII